MALCVKIESLIAYFDIVRFCPLLRDEIEDDDDNNNVIVVVADA